MDDRLAYLSASGILDLFRTRKLSPVELMQSLIERSERVEPTIHAFSDQYQEEALAAARIAEEKYMNGNQNIRPLEGVPFSAKVSLSIHGLPWTSGSLIHQDRKGDHTEPCIERLMQAGAILHAQTACPEFAWAWTCYSRIYGITHNPWNTDITPGGSCGGSAAALAAGTTVISLGADSAGSIRMPSAMCGVIGYKPPNGRNPEGPAFCEDFYNDIGPMVRTVEDCVRIQNIVAGPHAADLNTLRPKLSMDWPTEGIKGMRVAFSMDLGFIEVANDVQSNTRALLGELRELGAVVNEIAVDWAEEACDAGDKYGDFMGYDTFQHAMTKHRDLLSDYTPYFAEGCARVSREGYIESFKATQKAWLKFGRILENHDVFICPTVATTEVPATMKPWDPMVINGKQMKRWVFTLLFSMFRCCPVLAVPSGRGKNDVPTGIQIVGRPYDDPTVFQVASALESGSNPILSLPKIRIA